MMKKYIILFILLLGVIPASLLAEETFAINDVLKKSAASYDKVSDYTCVFSKRELVKGSIIEENNIVYKFMKPLCIYMKWTEGSNKGNEAIYIQGKFNNKLQVHLGGLFNIANFSLDPKGSMAMKENRHSINEGGIGYIIDLIKQNVALYLNNSGGAITYKGRQAMDGRDTLLFEAEFPEGRGYYGHRMLINIDSKTYLPVKTEIYGWQDEFLEQYYYSQLRINPGLTDKDFDLHNPEYKF